MKKLGLGVLLVSFLICVSCSADKKNDSVKIFLNLGFDYVIPETDIPDRWLLHSFEDEISLESIEGSTDKSLRVKSEYPIDSEYRGFSMSLPVDWLKGKTVELKGRIKTEDVQEGYAGYWCRVTGMNGVLIYNTMEDQQIAGTTDWQSVSLLTDIDTKAAEVTIGGKIVGTGTAWFDDLEIYIDGKKFIDPEPIRSELNEGQLAALRKYIHPLKTVNPTHPDTEDLAILGKMIGEARIVGLGEVTHGSSEIFQMKDRIFRYLATEHQFDIFSIEATMAEATGVNHFILTGEGEAASTLPDLYFWTWNTTEMVDLINWMRTYNEQGNQIQYMGFDVWSFFGALRQLRDQLGFDEQNKEVIEELSDVLSDVFLSYTQTFQMAISEEQRIQIESLMNKLNTIIIDNNLEKNEKEWLLQNLTLIHQFMNFAYGKRDKFMADNLLWIKEHHPDSKIVAWAHNQHIGKNGYKMGRQVYDQIKDEYVNIGFVLYEGEYLAVGDGLSNSPLQDAYPGTIESILKSVDEPLFILDLREIKNNKALFDWLSEYRSFRTVGGVKLTNEFENVRVIDEYDILLFINSSTPSHLLWGQIE